MSPRTLKALLLATLLFCCTLISAQREFDLSRQLEPEGPLKVRLDFPLAIKENSRNWKDRMWLVSSHLVFEESVTSITNEQLIQIGLDAYEEIVPEIRLYAPILANKIAPAAMNVLALGNEIFLTSSYKGGGGDFVKDFPKTEVSRLLEQCTAIFQRTQFTDEEMSGVKPVEGNSHRTHGHCGEITGFHLYSRLYPDQPLRLRTERPRSVTIGFDRQAGRVQVIEECSISTARPGVKPLHGCKWVNTQQRVNYLAIGEGEPYRLVGDGAIAGGLVGGLDGIGQLRMCD